MAKKSEEKKSLEEVLKEIEKQYGVGSVINGDQIIQNVEVIDTGSIGLNIALGCGGWPMGKIIDVYGWESAGKSTMIQTAIGNYQKMNKGKVLLIDGENSLDADYATNLGIDLSKLLVMQLDASAGEGAYDKMEKLVRTGEVGMVVIDSYNSLQPRKIVEGETSDYNIGLHAKMLGNAVMKANALCSEYGTTFFFLGQLRQKIGVMFGSPDTPQGGVALRFYAHVRAEVTRSTTKDNSVMEGDVKLGNKTTVKVVKNKLSKPFTQASFDILYSIGIDKIGELIEIGKEFDILKIRAGFITYGDIKYPEDTFRVMLEDNEDFMKEVKDQIMEKITNPTHEKTTTVQPADIRLPATEQPV